MSPAKSGANLARCRDFGKRRRVACAGETAQARGARSRTLTDDQTFRAVWLVALLLMVVAATLPFAGRHRHWLRQGAIWVLIGGFLFAFYRIAEWLWE
jgi:hypothetical protein